MDFKWYGDDLIKKIKEINGKYSYEEIFTSAFMKKYTKSNNFEEFISKSGLGLKEFKQETNKNLDEYVRKNTNNYFTSWKLMRNRAIMERIKNKLK